MANLVCLLLGHKKTPVVFASSRFFCRRCGIDLGVRVAPEQPPQLFPATTKLKRKPDRRRRYR